MLNKLQVSKNNPGPLSRLPIVCNLPDEIMLYKEHKRPDGKIMFV
jgi:hypothetical protein